MTEHPIAHRVDDATRVTRCSRTMIYEAMRSGALPYRKVGRRTFIMHDDLKTWFERVTSGGEHPAA